MEKRWYKLDNAGKLYPSITRTRISTVFRLSATLFEEIDIKKLQNALDKSIKRFPYFNVTLKRGFFWYYFEENHKKLEIEKETYYPCMFLSYKKSGTFPLRVLYYKNRISVEFSHSITDGTGAMAFLQYLIEEYLIEKGLEIKERILDDIIDEEEWQDSFKENYKKEVPPVVPPKKAEKFRMPLINKGEYYIINGSCKVEDLKKFSKKYDSTITEMLIAIYFETLTDFFSGKKVKNPIVLNVPVNLRKIFNSKTMKNFFISLTPQIDMRLGKYTREELIEYIKSYFKLRVKEKNFLKYIKRNVKGEHVFIVKIVPLFIKNLAISMAYNKLGESSYTSGISNMGLVKFRDKKIDDYIKSIHFYPPPSRENKIKLGIVSYKDKVQITFGKLTTNTEIEKIFFRKLRKEDIRVKIATNIKEE